MYYITNQNNHIIAADDSLLSLLQVDSIDELSKRLILGDIHFQSLQNEDLEISTADTSFHYTTKRASLSSLLGELQLVSLEAIVQEQEDISDLILSDDTMLETPSQAEKEPLVELPDADDLISVKESLDVEESRPEVTLPSLDELTIGDEPSTPTAEEKLIDDELFDLTIANEPQETIDEIKVEEETFKTIENTIQEEVPGLPEVKESLDTTPIVINIDEVSQNIGISTEDYKTFLDEYIDTAISLESDLKSDNNEQRGSAVSTLTQLADVLELPSVNEIITPLNDDSMQNRMHIVESFYATLSRITTKERKVEREEAVLDEIPVQEEMTLNEPTPVTKPEPAATTKSFGTLDLSDVKPIHFDFKLEEAANDLSLPVELIEEFVHDFIDQANSETKKMLTAYEEGDLDAIQKIGHLLKGASSNLRISALSDTLYEIQFCEDSTKLEDLIKRYWGHFLSFEQQIDILSN